ncbi:hypothetical protein [Chryseobacterium taiwanense]|nr:hypothetical protein [Chryseobacterium taiwanense]
MSENEKKRNSQPIKDEDNEQENISEKSGGHGGKIKPNESAKGGTRGG